MFTCFVFFFFYKSPILNSSQNKYLQYMDILHLPKMKSLFVEMLEMPFCGNASFYSLSRDQSTETVALRRCDSQYASSCKNLWLHLVETNHQGEVAKKNGMSQWSTQIQEWLPNLDS